MATTSYLYHALGLTKYTLKSTEYLNGWTYFHIQLKNSKRCCRLCKSSREHLKLSGKFERTFFALPCGLKPQFLVLHGHRQYCLKCKALRREPVFFAEGQKRYQKGFGRFIVELCKLLPIKHVALLLGVSWDLVKDIHKDHLFKTWKRKDLKDVRYVAIDEFAIQKGHRYMTIVMDLENGEILHVGKGKDGLAIKSFLVKLRSEANLKAVAMDMSVPFRSVFQEVFAESPVDLVHDPFHVVAMVNRAIDEARRTMMRDMNRKEKIELKGSRFILLRGLEKLNEKGIERLIHLMEINKPLYQAYLLKEDFRTFWSLSPADGATFLDHWIHLAKQTGIKQFRALAKSFKKNRKGILNYLKYHISTGPLEGLNNKIKVLKRQAYGFRDELYFKLLLFHLHNRKPKTVLADL